MQNSGERYVAAERAGNLIRDFNAGMQAVRSETLRSSSDAIRLLIAPVLDRFIDEARMSSRERLALAAAAYERLRGAPPRAIARIHQAETKQVTRSMVGAGEDLFAGWLAERGVRVIPQLAVGRYNIDLAAWPVAVEIHLKPGNPLRHGPTMERIKYLASEGWRVLYVWSKRGKLTEAAAADVVRWLWLPGDAGDYRVIRGTAEFVAEGSIEAF
jgi:very-short-patch-repair endonuclease